MEGRRGMEKCGLSLALLSSVNLLKEVVGSTMDSIELARDPSNAG